MTEKNRKARLGLPRTEVFAMRLDPKIKYLADIAARQQRRSVANFIEWAIEHGLKATVLGDERSVMDRSPDLWDVNNADRFAKLALNFPELMSYDEQILWKYICETGEFWKGKLGSDGELQWNPKDGSKLKLETLRLQWYDLEEEIAAEEEGHSILPKKLIKPKIMLQRNKQPTIARTIAGPVLKRKKDTGTP